MNTIHTMPSVAERIIVFGDISGYHRHICLRSTPEENLTFLSEFYSIAHRIPADSRGRIVTFMGDSILIVFPGADPNGSLSALRQLKAEVDSFLAHQNLNSRLGI